ncbi:MAG: hypothetical protein LBU04_02325 [Christensenellaceae bacterium]|jgi:stage III sporulation protein AG|nr:hypothetical protein [Christensenellaceae bacterium]
MESFKAKAKEIIKKAKTIKNIEIIVGMVIIAIVAIIYSNITVGNSKSSKAKDDKNINSEKITTEFEGKLAGVLSQIQGAGNVSVMIAFDGTTEIITANTTNTHTNSTAIASGGGTTTSTETISPIVVNNNGKSELIIIKEILPEIKGVIIVAEGASNTKVRLELLRAARAILGLSADKIEVFAMK